MKQAELQEMLQHEPFRPFSIRLSNGEVYDFLEPRDLGAPRKVKYTIYHFGDEFVTRIDVEHIAEIFEK